MEAKQEEKVIITINGKKYDVTQWRHLHEGGDVYTDGTDMTVAFIAQHGHDFTRLQPFEVKEGISETSETANTKVSDPTARRESTQIIDRSDDATDLPKPYSMADLDKALADEDF